MPFLIIVKTMVSVLVWRQANLFPQKGVYKVKSGTEFQSVIITRHRNNVSKVKYNDWYMIYIVQRLLQIFEEYKNSTDVVIHYHHYLYITLFNYC